jgi:hypothetical protein
MVGRLKGKCSSLKDSLAASFVDSHSHKRRGQLDFSLIPDYVRPRHLLPFIYMVIFVILSILLTSQHSLKSHQNCFLIDKAI